jgi:ATP-dependent DNA helicase RecG
MNETLSSINSIVTTYYLKNQPENQYFERKGLGEKETKPSKLAEEIIGMLNADGGILAFGVSNTGEIQDLAELGADLEKYRTLTFDFIHPSCSVQLEELIIDGKLIFLYHVEQDIEQVYCRKDNEKIYLRVQDTNRELNRDQVSKLEYDKGKRQYEEEIITDFDIEDLDLSLLEEYKQKLNYHGSVMDLLVKRHLARLKDGIFQIKISAILLFSKDPEKYIPSASFRYIRYQGNEALTGVNHNVIKDERFENNIPRLILRLKDFLNATINDYYFLDMQSGRFRKVPEYPEEAWLEGLVNALCHRSYNVQGNAIYIRHFDNRIEFFNSGPLPAQVTIENIKTERFARNPRIARVLEEMGFVRQLNEGVSRIYESMEKSMLSVPEYKEENGNVHLVLRNKISNHTKTIPDQVLQNIENQWIGFNDTQKKIIEYLFLNHQGTLKEFVSSIGINEKTIRQYLTEFVRNELLERHSNKLRDIEAVYTLKKL